MPEGDAIARYAARLRPDLIGVTLTELVVRHRGTISFASGRAVRSIEVRGKNMLTRMEGALTLHTHLGMNGRWTRAANKAGRPRGRDQPSAILAVDDCEWRCLHAMRAEVLQGDDAVRTHPSLSALGPDVLADIVDWDEIVRRARDSRHERKTIADLLLIQRVACGLGTIYRSESLFVCRQSPWTPVVAVADERIVELYQTARELMQRSVAGERRVDSVWRPAARAAEPASWVYNRTGKPCLECGRRIESRRHSDHARQTYFCRWCQIEAHR